MTGPSSKAIVGRLAVATAALAVLVACGAGAASDGSTAPTADRATLTADVTGEVLVFAAASLTDAFTEVGDAFEAANPGTTVTLNLAGSSALREQLLAGAPADVFAAANAATMEAVVDAGLARSSAPFATNELVLAVPAANEAGVTGTDDLADPGLLVGLCAEGVPCGDLARELLADAGIEPAVDTNETDVRALLGKIALGELDAGLVYRTDVVAAGDEVTGIDVPPGLDAATAYPIAALDEATNPRGATAFVAFVLSEPGREILAAAGFGPAPS